MTQPPEEGTAQAPSAAAGAAPATTTPATAAFVGHAGYLPCPSGRVIFCVSHPAVGAAASADSSTAGHQQSARGTIVLVQTCTEERKASHRAMVGLAGRLAAAGYTTHRLDLPGCGESTGRLAALRLADWIADLTAVATRLLAVVPAEQRRYFGGLRLSAALAGCCDLSALAGTPPAGRGEPPRSAPRWLGIAPVAKGADWLRQLRTRRSIRSSLTLSDGNAAGARPAGSASAGDAGIVAAAAPDAAGGEDFDGFVFGAAMLADLERLDLQRDLRPSRGVLIQAGAARTLSRESTVLGGAPRRLTLQAVRQEPFWERGEAVDITPLAEALLAALEADATSAQ